MYAQYTTMIQTLQKRRILSIFFGVLLVSSAAQVCSDELLRNLEKGDDSLEEFTGNGKWVIVKFWASDCHICNQEAHQYIDFHEFHKDIDAVMLGISLDGRNREAAQEFIRRHQVSYPNLITELSDGAQLYSNLSGQSWIGTPSFLVFDPSGVLRAQQAGAVPAELIEGFIEKNRHATGSEVD